MATIKSYTSLEQSRKLADVLPIESSDMYYPYDLDSHKVLNIPIVKDDYCMPCIHCWSLAALLSVIPKHIKDYNVLRIDISENEFAIWYDEIGCGVNNELPDITKKTAIDACYEMILKLHELKML